MKKFLLALALCIWSGRAWAASSVSILPYFGLSNISTATLEFIPVYPGVGSSLQVGLFVVNNSTKAWTLNMKADPFILDESTITLPYGEVTYRIFSSSSSDLNYYYFLPISSTTVYWATPSEYNTKGTTVTLIINISPERGVTTIGHYRSKLYVETGL